MKQWYQISLICGLLPLGTGVSIFLAWLVTRASWLEIAGILNLYAGLVLFSIGIISLSVYFCKVRKSSIQGYWKRITAALVILLANFPIAAAVFSAALYVVSTSIVIIENKSSIKIENIYLSERGHVYEIGSVSPNKKLEKDFHFQSEGSVYYSLTRNGIKHEGIMFGYVTHGMGSTAIMVITESGEVKVETKI